MSANSDDPIVYTMLERRDFVALTDAIRALTTAINTAELARSRELNGFAPKAHTETRDAIYGMRDEIRGLRGDMQQLAAAFAAKVGNGHDTHPDRDDEQGDAR